MDSLITHVEDLLRHVADQEIMSRFGRLGEGDIRHKSREGDLVTTADLEAENRLREGLTKLLPESLVVGEEGTHKNPKQIDAFKGSHPVWVVDPVDGTGNFARGKPCFAVICALVVSGETRMGWILDPISGTCAVTEIGHGARIQGQPMVMRSPDGPQSLIGSLGERIQQRLNKRKAAGDDTIPNRFVRYHCVGREYMDLAMGKLHFALYGGRLMPWDHAAGALMVAEAGGICATVEGMTPYNCLNHGHGERLLIAPDQKSHATLCALFNQG